MEVKMVKLAAGPAGCKEIGKVYDVSEAEGAELIKAGAAVATRKPESAKEKASREKAERAVRADAEKAEKRGALEAAWAAAQTSEEQDRIEAELKGLDQG